MAWFILFWAGRASADVAIRNIPGTLRQLRQDTAQLQLRLDSLPKLNDALQLEAYGYHGGYLPALNKLPSKPRWTLDFFFKDYFRADQVILVPAVDHRFGRVGSYGFPKRFRVLLIDDEGSETVIKEWMTEDCPDLGRYPHVLAVPEPKGNHIRIEVFRGAVEGDQEFIAIDELFGIMAAADHECDRMTASLEYEAPPYWARRYLFDHKSSLGLPLGVAADTADRKEDFATFFNEEPPGGCTIELDLGRNCLLGWVTLFPAQNSDGVKVPGFGFPADIEMEIIRESNGQRSTPQIVPRKWGMKRPGNNVVRLPASQARGRWLRITFKNLPEHNGRPTLALGEIRLYRLKEIYPVQSVSLEGFPENASAIAERLYDGHAAGKPVLFLTDWLQLIEQRRILQQKYSGNLLQIQTLEKRWKSFWMITTYTVICLLALGASGLALTSVFQRKKAVKELKWRITRDLHDDVGSSLGSISLTAGRLEEDVNDDRVKEDLADLALLAREASASLREVVWVIDQSEIRLPDLVKKLAQRAERVLTGKELKISIAASIPDQAVPLSFKRHLILFFKEVIHNCARHSCATQVRIEIAVDHDTLIVEAEDNGKGFEPDKVVDGWGLESLKKRAEELGGTMMLRAVPDLGTSVRLTIPLKSIFTNVDHRYKTSN
ncbi:sensor histidine kinase [Pontiella agarivorans]|uniref:sensor histidine kinase n=1 Tax=Pontiella agarivorans TaxID=3038953 RepID=UPI002AD46C1E|nr:histidine kinase [Pontiella agarivorans]